MRPVLFALSTALLLLATSQSSAQTAAVESVEAIPVTDLEPMVVSGAQPGPGMWKVSRDGHVLWILGTLSPLPKKMEWQSRDVEAVIAQSQQALYEPGLVVNAKIGFFQGLMMAPKLLGIRKNPDGAELQQVVPADMYARWLPLKRKYVGSGRGIEKWRPMFAAMELYDDAIGKSGMTQSSAVKSVIADAVKRNKVKWTPTALKLVIEDPKAALNDFRDGRIDDIDCFDKTLQRLETDLGTMIARANAWAVGDIDRLRQLPYGDQDQACIEAATQAGFARKRGFGDIDERVEKAWLDVAETALASNRVTFATLPMSELLKPDGYLARLQAKGYAVEAP